MRAASLSTFLTFALAGTAFAQSHPATLAGHVLIPAATFIPAPADAPDDLKISGKFTTGKRVDAAGTIEGRSRGRPTGVKLPFNGQPAQGHSGIKRMPEGTFLVLTDNGFGNKANSPDAMLFLSQFRLNWDKGSADRLTTIFLHDPDRKVPFRIANEGTTKRYLTGSDFDLESFQPIGDKFWFAEEFGPI
jgi:hypothetical protein